MTYGEAAERLALAAGGRDEIKLQEQEKLKARKKPEKRDESHQSGARFVGWRGIKKRLFLLCIFL